MAIKAVYALKHELPFDNRDQTVSVMAIKAIGTITENLGDEPGTSRWIGRRWIQQNLVLLYLPTNSLAYSARQNGQLTH